MWMRISIFRLFVSSFVVVSFAACSNDNANDGTAGQTPSDASQQAATSSTAGSGNAAVAGGVTGASGSSGALAATGAAGTVNAAGTAAAAGAKAAGAGAKAAAGKGGAGVAGSSGGKAGKSGTAGAGGSAPVTCPSTILPPGETTTTLQIGGVARTFILYVPQSSPARYQFRS
jgi:hypothetical protein